MHISPPVLERFGSGPAGRQRNALSGRWQFSLRELLGGYTLAALAAYGLAQLDYFQAMRVCLFLSTILPWALAVFLMPCLLRPGAKIAVLEILARASSLCVVGLSAASIEWPVSVIHSLMHLVRLSLEVMLLNLFFVSLGVLVGGFVGIFCLPMICLIAWLQRLNASQANGNTKLLLYVLPWACLGFSLALMIPCRFIALTGKSLIGASTLVGAFVVTAIGIAWLKSPWVFHVKQSARATN